MMCLYVCLACFNWCFDVRLKKNQMSSNTQGSKDNGTTKEEIQDSLGLGY
jgi:hypothetical protein